MTAFNRIHQERVQKAVSFQKTDRTPRDFAAVPEIWNRLGERFGTADRNAILGRLDVDCRVVSYDGFCRPPGVEPDGVDMEASQERSSVGGMWRRVEPDGTNRDIWGAHRKRVANAFGELDQLISYPLESAGSLDDLRRYPWPRPEWWDFSGLRRTIDPRLAAEHEGLARPAFAERGPAALQLRRHVMARGVGHVAVKRPPRRKGLRGHRRGAGLFEIGPDLIGRQALVPETHLVKRAYERRR